MAKKRRTKKQKKASQARAVNTQFQVSFNAGSPKTKAPKKPIKSEQFEDLGSIKKELIRSLIIASLILGSIVVLYWFQ
ncbi:hypothetical protein ISR94_03695 [Candidatus Microgenomates bacterium]|nr:hypothetical protein [Candidatus Microgenomates bacterium]